MFVHGSKALRKQTRKLEVLKFLPQRRIGDNIKIGAGLFTGALNRSLAFLSCFLKQVHKTRW